MPRIPERTGIENYGGLLFRACLEKRLPFPLVGTFLKRATPSVYRFTVRSFVGLTKRSRFKRETDNVRLRILHIFSNDFDRLE